MRLDDHIDALLRRAGAVSAGCAELHPVPELHTEALRLWLALGHNAGMGYMANHAALRADPAELLPGACSVISVAFSYVPAAERPAALPQIAWFAYGEDYHDLLRRRLQEAVERLKTAFGGEYRICIDSAPVFERYWAEECGIGRRCDNGLVAVPGHGTRVLLAEILTTLPLRMIAADDDATAASLAPQGACTHCGACRRACPAGALQADSTVDARRCLSYLTIEHRGEWDADGLRAMRTPAGRDTLFGCDICQRVCPLNRDTPVSEIVEFKPSEKILHLTAEDAAAMTQEDFSRSFKGSPIKRSKLAGLRRNALNCLESRR